MIPSSTMFVVRRLLRQLPAGCAVLVLILVPILCYSHAEEHSDNIVTGKYVKFYSKILDEEATILVHLPYAYDRTHLSYPVLYSLDGDDVSRFSKSAATLEELDSNGKIPEMILITPANTDRIPIRLDNDPDSLRAGEFIRFMVEELIPFVDENYRTADYKILFGQSNAGLFTVYSLLDRPESFNAYIASSPMLGWCSDFIFKKAEDLFDGNRSLDNFLFIIYGKSDYDRVTSYVPDFARLLETKAPRDFRWKVKVLDEEGHVPYTSLYDGLQAVFSDWDFAEEREAEAGLEEIKDFYKSLSETYGFNAQIPFGLLLDLAMRYVGQGTLDEAVEVLKVNVEQYPYSGGAYYYLAEVYRRKDNNELAIENYQKALEVDPEYSRREMILRRIESLR